MSQKFQPDIDDVKKILKTTTQDLSTRSDIKKKYGNVTKINIQIKNLLNQAHTKINSLEEQIKTDEKSQNISKGEAQRRKKVLQEVRIKYFDANQQYEDTGSQYKQIFTPSHSESLYEGKDHSSISMDQLKEDRSKLEKQFDSQVVELTEATDTLKSQQLVMRDDLSYQSDHLLPKIEMQADRNRKMMAKSIQKLDRLLQKGSTCRLWCILILEAIVFILLIMY